MKKSYKNILLIIVFVLMLGVSINVYGAAVIDSGVSASTAKSGLSCTGVFHKDFLEALRDYVYKPIKYLTPTLLLVLTSLDFAKVVFAGKKEEMDKAKNNFLKRAMAALIIFFAPDIIILIADLAKGGVGSIKACLEMMK